MVAVILKKFFDPVSTNAKALFFKEMLELTWAHVYMIAQEEK